MATKDLLRVFAGLLLVTAALGGNVYYSTCIAVRDSSNEAISVGLKVRFYGENRHKTPFIILQNSDPDHTIGENQADCYNKSAPNVGTEVKFMSIIAVNYSDPLCINCLSLKYGTNPTMQLFDSAIVSRPAKCFDNHNRATLTIYSGAGQRQVCGSLLVLSVLATLTCAMGIFTY